MFPLKKIIRALLKHLSLYMVKGGASLAAQLVKESTCNAGDPSSISGLGRSPEEGIG